MLEGSVPRLTFEQMQGRAVKPDGVPVERWDIGMAVAKHLMHEGIPVRVLEESKVGKNFPKSYYMTGTGVTVEHMPHWSHANVYNGLTRTQVSLAPDTKEPSPNGNSYSPQEVVLSRLKKAVVKAWR